MATAEVESETVPTGEVITTQDDVEALAVADEEAAPAQEPVAKAEPESVVTEVPTADEESDPAAVYEEAAAEEPDEDDDDEDDDDDE